MKLLTKIVLGVSLAVAANAATVFVTQDVDLKEAKIYSGFPFTQNGKKVEYKGFLKDNSLYATKNLSLKIADIKDESALKKVGEQAILAVNIPEDSLSEDQFDAWDSKEEIFLEKCSQCHAAPDVPHHTMLEWEGLFVSMKGFAQPTAEEEAVILRYLKSFAKDGILKEEE